MSPDSPPVADLVERLWPDRDTETVSRRLVEAVGSPVEEPNRPLDQRSAMLITYADTVRRPGERPLTTLVGLLDGELGGVIDAVHVLPFYPSSSDDGFAVVDHRQVRADLGTWADLEQLAGRVSVMADLVVNHVSADSMWFDRFRAGSEPGRDYFVTVRPGEDLSAVTRARSHPLLRAVDTPEGERHVWCTFSHDQPDLDYRNPDVLVEMLTTLDTLLLHGVRLVRLDAIAFVWKEPGTSSLHRPETHDLVRLLRRLVAWRCPSARLVTETNVPHDENLSYLVGGDQAHFAYDFTLASLLIHAAMAEDASLLTTWLSERAGPPTGTSLLVFLASHDGVGMRPIEELISADRIRWMTVAAERCGGAVSTYETPTGPRPYELNVALADLLADGDGPDRYERFLGAHRALFSLAGVPAIYLHSLLASPGDRAAAEASGLARRLNRGTVSLDAVGTAEVGSVVPHGARGKAFETLVALLRERSQLPAFSPPARQEVLDLGPDVLAVRRGEGADRLLAVTNMTSGPVTVVADGHRIELAAWRKAWIPDPVAAPSV